jgi:hypothetical protein
MDMLIGNSLNGVSRQQDLAKRHLNPSTIEDAGLLDTESVAALFKLHEASDTFATTQTQLNAVTNHLIQRASVAQAYYR